MAEPVDPTVGAAPAGDEYFERAPRYGGGDFREVWVLPDKATGLEVFRDVSTGGYDKFYGQAWYQAELRQNRNAKGQFERGFRLVITFRRPLKEEDTP